MARYLPSQRTSSLSSVAQMWQTVHIHMRSLVGAMWVDREHLVGVLLGGVLPPDLRPRKEEALTGGEAVDGGLGSLLVGSEDVGEGAER